MDEGTDLSRARVVDFSAYRTQRARQRLPLLEQDSTAGDGLTPALPARSLDGHQIEHRERMLRHLAGT